MNAASPHTPDRFGKPVWLGRHHVVEIPLQTSFRRVTSRRSLLICGDAGWGEFSPFAEYGPAQTQWWRTAAIEAATTVFPAPVRDTVPVNTTIPAVDPKTAHAMAAASGCTTAKVKVAERGQNLAADQARIEAVADALGPNGRIRIDANAGWDVDTAIRVIPILDRAARGLEYVEQPCATLDEFATVKASVDVPLAADESVRLAPDPFHIDGIDVADVVVIKVQPLGGVRRCLNVIDALGKPAVVSSAVETSIGLAAGVALAAALPDLPYACGLGTVSLLTGDVTDAPLQPVSGAVPVRRVCPDDDLIDRFAADNPDQERRRFAAAKVADQ